MSSDTGTSADEARLKGEREPSFYSTLLGARVSELKGKLARIRGDGFAAGDHFRDACKVLLSHYGKKDFRVVRMNELVKTAFDAPGLPFL